MPSSRNRVAIIGASSLLGKELKQVLEDRNFPASDIILLDESVLAGTLTEAAGEPTFIRALDEDSFDGVRFAFFAGTPADARRNAPIATRAGATVIDLSGALGANDGAVAWIPSLGRILPPRPARGGNGKPAPPVYSSPSSAVIVSCTVAAAASGLSPDRIALLLFPPVSERDQAGVDELESQTASLLSFRPIEQTVFDAQVAFNLLAGYGASSKPALADTRAAIAATVAQILLGRAAVPAIQLLQAPVFYGYAFAAYAQLAAPDPEAAAQRLEAALAAFGVKIAPAGDPAPSNVSVAGENDIHLAPIARDSNVPGALWLWGAVDNLRLAARNAVQIAEELLAQSSS